MIKVPFLISMKPAIPMLCVLLLVSCHDLSGGYKIVAYSQGAHEATPEFIIIHHNMKITATPENYDGWHIGCDQLKNAVPSTIREGHMRYAIGSKEILVFNPNWPDKPCNGKDTCEYLVITKVQSIN